MGGLPPQNDSTYPVYFGVIALYINSTYIHQDVEIKDMEGLVSYTRLQSKSSKQMFTSQTALKTCRSSLTQDHAALI